MRRYLRLKLITQSLSCQHSTLEKTFKTWPIYHTPLFFFWKTQNALSSNFNFQSLVFISNAFRNSKVKRLTMFSDHSHLAYNLITNVYWPKHNSYKVNMKPWLGFFVKPGILNVDLSTYCFPRLTQKRVNLSRVIQNNPNNINKS